MKIRIHKDFVRLRLNRPEVEALIQTGTVESAIRFGTNSLVYRLSIANGKDPISSQIDNNCISIDVAEDTARYWAQSEDEIGFEHNTADGVAIKIEKDLRCRRKKPGVNDTDNFPNPKAHIVP